jgi:hypothetical protein
LRHQQLFVATLLTKQPFFVGGISDYVKAREAAYGAMWAYIVCTVVSLILIVRESRRQRHEVRVMRSTYQQVPRLPLHDFDLDLPNSVTEGVYTEGVFS